MRSRSATEFPDLGHRQRGLRRVAPPYAGLRAWDGTANAVRYAPFQGSAFGRYGSDLVAAGEGSGRIFAIAPDGVVVTLAASGLPHGGDIDVEGTGFVPPGFGAIDAAYLADQSSPGHKHPGTNSMLRLPGAELVKVGVRAGDLLAATEASARNIVVHCDRTRSMDW